jgi:hypothetical protein
MTTDKRRIWIDEDEMYPVYSYQQSEAHPSTW